MDNVIDLDAGRHDLYRARLAHARRSMRAVDMPALLITDPNNIFYLTGARNMQLFGLRSPSRFLLAFQQGPVVLFEFTGCEHLAIDLPTIDCILPAMGLNKLSSGDNADSNARALAKQIRQLVDDHDASIDRLGVDRFPFQTIDALRAAGFALCDADDALIPARAIKLAEELPYLREAMRRVEASARRLEDTVRPGMTESQAWAEFHYAFMAKEGQYISTRLFQSGPNSFPYFQEADTRVLQAGDLLCLDTDALGYEGYAVDFSRTFLCADDRPDDAQRKLYQQAREQLETNAALLKAGVEYREIAEKAWPVPEQYQASRYYCVGHGLGMAGEFPNIPHHVSGQPYPLSGVLEPGMIICIESYIGSAESGQGVKLEDQFLITENSVERMSGYHFDERLSA
jgi:Xaa-Pro aminopeptidase